MSTKPSPYSMEFAKLDWQTGDIPEARHFQDIYFYKEHGLKESEYVFLQQNHLQQRWQQLDPNQTGTFTIAETGFGTGLNFLLTWALWQQYAPENWRLNYISVEKHPLLTADLQRSLKVWPSLQPLAKQLVESYPPLIPGQHLLTLNTSVQLQLLFGDAAHCFEQLLNTNHPALSNQNGFAVDAWFFDGFTPAKNPDMWSRQLFLLASQLSKPGSTFSSFTAATNVRRELEASGFNVKKEKGFGRKREMIRGEFIAHPKLFEQPKAGKKTNTTPWYFHKNLADKKTAIVIGGGLAGVLTANALARRGCKVTLIERHHALAQEGSGNPQGILYTKLSPHDGTLNQFTLSSYLYAMRFYRSLLNTDSFKDSDVNFCGVLQLARTDKEKQLYPKLQQAFQQHPQMVQFINAEVASSIAGIDITDDASYFPLGGWVSPIKVCETLAKHPLINIIYDCEAITINQDQDQWLINDNHQKTIARADIVVIANSRDAQQFEQTQSLPLKTIRGQVSFVDENNQSKALKSVICHEGYLTPAINGQHSLGATFDNHISNKSLLADDHLRNLNSLNQAVPVFLNAAGLAENNFSQLSQTLNGRAGLRCTSSDYLPVVGAVHQTERFSQDYASLAKDAKKTIATPGAYYSGLYINIAHGSRGLTSIPLCSELLATIIFDEVRPMPRQLITAIHPARFSIRNITRGKSSLNDLQ
jgi:tRNA 5-methylaminomethyl-2-thiouridine biosynthesis bifunctional protein